MQPEGDDHRARAEARRRAVRAAQTWYPTEGGLRDYAALALATATLVGAAMAWSCLPMAMALIGGEGEAEVRFQFLFAFVAMIVTPALGWLLWLKRRTGFALGVLVIFGLCVAVLLPVARG